MRQVHRFQDDFDIDLTDVDENLSNICEMSTNFQQPSRIARNVNRLITCIHRFDWNRKNSVSMYHVIRLHVNSI